MSSLTFSLLQADLFWENKASNREMFQNRINALKGKTEIVVLPEMFTTGFSMNTALAESMDGETIQWMKLLSKQNNIILTGSLIIKENSNFYNRLVWMLPTGEFGLYDKRHLFAYSEENKYYQRGHKRLITSVKGWKIKVQVCYDLRFPVWSRQTPPVGSTGKEGELAFDSSPEYDILLYVANWPEQRSHAWKTLLSARAIENQCYVIGVNRVGMDGNNNRYSGDSMVIDPNGEVLYYKTKDEDSFTITLDKEILDSIRKKYPFLQDGDRFIIHP